MEYLVFPFGKYRGVELTELPSTYIVLALEKFELPNALTTELRMILLGRLDVWGTAKILAQATTKKRFVQMMSELVEKYPNQKNIEVWND
jgi:uncharacterized protein (DUF3820 family)